MGTNAGDLGSAYSVEPLDYTIDCEECGKPVDIEYNLCSTCAAKLEGREWDEFNQDRASRFDD